MIRITLAAARKNAGYTQTQVATMLKKSKTTIVAWESGKTKIDLANLAMLSEIYGMPIDNLILPCNLT